MAVEKISELVWLYVKKRPFLQEVLRQKVVNYSSLARRIALEAFGSKKQIIAVKAALIRLSDRLAAKSYDMEEKVLSTLKGSSVNMQSKVSVVISSSELPVRPISFVKSRDFITYILRGEDVIKLRKLKQVTRIEENASLIIISSSEDIEETPGVISMMLNSLAAEGINVIEFISCYTDTFLVVAQANATRAYEVLASLTD